MHRWMSTGRAHGRNPVLRHQPLAPTKGLRTAPALRPGACNTGPQLPYWHGAGAQLRATPQTAYNSRTSNRKCYHPVAEDSEEATGVSQEQEKER
jgi:hypothetical protein